jgi:hypothetical protein
VAQDGQPLDPGTRVILAELRDLRLEMRADRRRADEERRRANEERRQEAAQATLDRRQAAADRRRSDERFEQMMREFRQDSARREAATHRAFREVRIVGLSIVKTLNRHTLLLERIVTHHGRLLERIDRKLGVRGNGPGPGNGRRA